MTPKILEKPVDAIAGARNVLADRQAQNHAWDAQWEAGCWRTVVGILRRQIAGKAKPNDPQRLADVVLDMQGGQVNVELEHLEHYAAAIQESERLHAAHAERKKAEQALIQAREEQAATRERHKQEERDARHKVGAACTRHNECQVAHRKLEELSLRFASIFDDGGDLPRVIEPLE